MKTPSESEIINEVKEIRERVKNDWSKYGDLAESDRDELIKKLNKIIRMLKCPVRSVEVRHTRWNKEIHGKQD